MDERSERVARRFELPIIVAALLVIPVIVIEESSLGEPWDTLGVVLNWATWTMFFAEAAVMLSIVPNRRGWIRQHLIDLAVVVLTPPFFTALAGVRLLRLLRLLRLFRVARFARRVFTPAGLRYVAALAALTAFAGGEAFTSLEKGRSTAEGLYWSLATMTTVGAGDIYPQTAAGRALAVVVVLIGIAFVAILTGAVAHQFFSKDIEAETADIEGELDEASTAILGELRAMRERLIALETAVQRRARP